MGRLQLYSENGFRSKTNNTILPTKDTLQALIKAFGQRNDMQLRFLRTPADVVYWMKEALKWATLASR